MEENEELKAFAAQHGLSVLQVISLMRMLMELWSLQTVQDIIELIRNGEFQAAIELVIDVFKK